MGQREVLTVHAFSVLSCPAKTVKMEFFLYLLRMIRASYRKEKDNFLNLFEEKDG